MTRDLRDPEKLGEAYRKSRAAGLDIEVAVAIPVPNLTTNPSCIEKYGRPSELEPVWEEVRVV